MSDIALIHPGGIHGIYGPLGSSLVAAEPPLWPRLLAGYLRDHGHSPIIIDQEVEGLSSKDVAERVASQRVRIAALVVHGHQPSASTQAMPAARAIAEAIIARSVHPIVVMLGNHPSALPDRTLEEEPCHYVIDGEAAVGLDALLHDAPAEEVPGLVWHDRRGNIVRNPLPPLLPMSELHGRAWDLLPPLTTYRAHNWQVLDGSRRTPYASIHTSLGCPYRCHFCMINVFQHRNLYRRRRPEEVISEIRYLAEEHGVRTFKIVDELFLLTPEHYVPIAGALEELPYASELNLWAYARTDTIVLSNLPLLRRAGFRWIALGIEAGDPRVREGANKALRGDKRPEDPNAAIKEVVAQIQAAGINVIGNYIFGLPDDDAETMARTLGLAIELRTEWANFYSAMAYPGSPLYEAALRDGFALPDTWAGYSQHNRHTRPLDTRHVSGAEVLAFRDRAFVAYYRDPGYRAHLVARFGPAALEEVDAMLRYDLVRDHAA